MLHIAICDDSPIHQQIIQSEIEKALNLPYEITLFSSGLKFLENISGGKCQYQIVFMDIALGKNDPSGILVAKKISLANPMTQIIFISQYLEFASDVYETTHVYFIAKDRLPELLEKALNTALSNLSENKQKYLYFKVKQGKQRVAINDLWYLEKNLRETILFTRSESFRTPEKLEELQKQLPPYFVVCHRSYAVNLKAVDSIHRSGLTLPNGVEIPIGRSHYENVKKAFSQHILFI